MEALFKLISQEMLNNMRLEWARYQKNMNPKGKNAKLAQILEMMCAGFTYGIWCDSKPV